MKIGLRELHTFITKKLPVKVLRHYKRFEILNESDLQFDVTRELRRFLRQDSEKRRLEAHGCLSCSDSKLGTKTYPDILITHRGRPWVIIELKESGRLRLPTAEAERDKIRRQRQTLKGLKRGYLFYVARWGRHRKLRGVKGSYGFWFYEVPASLERRGMMTDDEISIFEKEFRRRAKYVG